MEVVVLLLTSGMAMAVSSTLGMAVAAPGMSGAAAV